jgi:brefeldin A-inhibited guanine nucleotide-exchange protein
MHAFVDILYFVDSSFIDALRLFLQSFRLSGEAQKIDRFMFKFAERYITGNSNTPFANTDQFTTLRNETWLIRPRLLRICMRLGVFDNHA